MSKWNILDVDLEGVKVIEAKYYEDIRGGFFEGYNQRDFFDLGITDTFVQTNFSISNKNVIRGIGYQKCYMQSKLIRVLAGEIYDVVVDLRKGNSTFGQHFGIKLSENNKRMLYIPKGFGHGFQVLQDNTVVSFMVSDYFHAGDEVGIKWDDPFLAIEWPEKSSEKVILSERDLNWPYFNQL